MNQDNPLHNLELPYQRIIREAKESRIQHIVESDYHLKRTFPFAPNAIVTTSTEGKGRTVMTGAEPEFRNALNKLVKTAPRDPSFWEGKDEFLAAHLSVKEMSKDAKARENLKYGLGSHKQEHSSSNPHATSAAALGEDFKFSPVRHLTRIHARAQRKKEERKLVGEARKYRQRLENAKKELTRVSDVEEKEEDGKMEDAQKSAENDKNLIQMSVLQQSKLQELIDQAVVDFVAQGRAKILREHGVGTAANTSTSSTATRGNEAAAKGDVKKNTQEAAGTATANSSAEGATGDLNKEEEDPEAMKKRQQQLEEKNKAYLENEDKIVQNLLDFGGRHENETTLGFLSWKRRQTAILKKADFNK
jgi:hypothetical protein